MILLGQLNSIVGQLKILDCLFKNVKSVKSISLRVIVKSILLETVSMFEEWLSPDIMDLLINEYANPSPLSGKLKWEYGPLPPNVWGQFVAQREKLYVNRHKTRGLFTQQVKTILHEIQHWNQFLEVASKAKATNSRDAVQEWVMQYRSETNRHGYVRNRFEIDARSFSEKHVDNAITKLGKHYGGKVEGGSYELALEELLDEFGDTEKVTRAQIGLALKAHNANTPENMKKAVTLLSDLGMKIR